MATRLRNLLRESADDYSESLLELDSKVSDRHFDRGSYIVETKIVEPPAFKTVRDTAVKMGTVLEEDEADGVVKAMLRGGAANLAPVLLVAIVSEDAMGVGAYSREGLIPQHAARKAVQQYMEGIEGS